MNNDHQRLLFVNGLNQAMAAEQIGVRSEYVSMYITGNGYLSRDTWQKIRDFFVELRIKTND